MPLRRRADYSIGRTLIGRGFAFAPLGKKYLNFPTGADFDPVHQRLFVPDGTTLGPPGARILVFDVHPEKLAELPRGDFPEAIAVLGQPNFDEWDPGVGPNKVGGRGSAMLDIDNQRLFFSDGRNNRVLVLDIRPEVLESGMDASYVLGQDDLTSNESGSGPNRFAGGAQLYANASEMFGEATDALWVDANEAIHIAARSRSRTVAVVSFKFPLRAPPSKDD